MKIATAFVELKVDSDKARTEAVSDARSIAKETTKAFAQFFTAAVVVRELGKATEAAARLEQAVGGTEAIFGEFSASVNDAAKVSAESMGLSESAFREVTSQIGGLLNGLGFTQDESAKTSVSLAQLGADLAATFGGSPEEAVQALGAALRGEFNPLERFGVSLRQSQINLKAVEMGLADSTTEVDANARAQAALALIQESTTQAQGQFGREAETAAGKAAILSAKFEDARAKLGEQLLPVFVTAVGLLEGLVDGFSALPGPIQVAVVAMAGLVAIAGPIKNAIVAIGGLKTAVMALKTAMIGHPILLLAGVAAAVGGALYMMSQRASESEKAIDDMAEAMRNANDAGDGMVEWLNTQVSEFDGFREALDAAGVSTQELADAALEGGPAWDELKERVRAAIEQTNSPELLQNAMSQWLDAAPEQVAAAVEKFDSLNRVQSSTISTADDAGAALEGEAEAMTGAVEGAEELGPGLDELADVQARLEEETQAARDAMFEQIATMFDLEQATLGLKDSYADYADQMVENFLIQNDAERSDREKEASARDLRQAEIDLAEEALGVAEAFAREKGAADGSRDSAELQRQKLRELQRQYPEIRDEIQRYIDKLGRVPGTVSTDIIVNTAGAQAEIDGLIWRNNGRDITVDVRASMPNMGNSGGGRYLIANGGFFNRATDVTIGEDGDEVALPLTRPSRIRELMGDPRVSGPIAAAMAGGGGSVATSGGGGVAVYPVVYGSDDAYIDDLAARIDERRRGWE